jgi:DNA polymerase-1
MTTVVTEDLRNFDSVKVHLVDSVEKASEFMRWLGERRPVLGFDTETEGLHWWCQNVRLAQFGDAQTGWSIPFERWGGVVEEVFKRYVGPVVGHNVRFDLRYMHKHGIEVNQSQTHDTMLSANAMWPSRRLSLKVLATELLTPYAASGEQALSEAMAKGNWTWATVPVDLPAYWAYGALDTILSARLHELLMPQLAAANLMDVYELECAVSRVLFKMETRGARIDVPFCQEWYDKLHAYTQDLRRYCQETFGVSPGATEEVLGYLQRSGYTFTKRTSGGKLALDEDVLMSCKTTYDETREEYDLHPLAQTVLNVRKNEKIANTYLRNFIALVGDDDMLHCSVRQVGARTGRMSITEPALQTLPRDNVLVRNAFIPLEGNQLVSVDYEQVEMRIFAHFAQEEEMIRRIRAGVDLHTAVAQVIYGLGDQKPSKHQRQVTKNANFAKVYGAGAAKFALTAHITEEEGRAFYAQYDAQFPGVRRFQQQVDTAARQRLQREGECYVLAPSGRRHVTDPRDTYKLVNYLVQGTAADVLKERLISLDNVGLGEFMVLPVHDEVIFDFPTEDAAELAHLAADTMRDTTSFSVPLEVDASAPMARWTK